MHNNAHIAAVDLNRHNDVVFQKTVMVTDWYHDGGDGHPLGTVQTIGKVQGLMMKSWATRVPLPLLDAIARRSVEWVVMAEDLPDPANRVTLSPERPDPHHPRRHEHPPARAAARPDQAADARRRVRRGRSPNRSTSA